MRRRGDLLLVTRAHLLSPGPFAAERGPDGRWAYRLADTPLALVSAEGRERRLGLRTGARRRRMDGEGRWELSKGHAPRGAVRRAPHTKVVLAALCGVVVAASAAAQVPDNRGVRLDPEDSVPPAYRDTLESRDRQRLDAAREGGRDLHPDLPGRGVAADAEAVPPRAARPGPRPGRKRSTRPTAGPIHRARPGRTNAAGRSTC